MSAIRNVCLGACVVAASLLFGSASLHAQTAFSYQGRLVDQGAPADGDYDFEFDLYTAVENGVLIAAGSAANGVPVRDGYFVTQVDFGAVFDGSQAWLEIKVRPAGSTDPFDTLSPRQAITLAPQALIADESLTAHSVDWSDVSNVPADIADGDDNTDTDTLAALACPDDAIAQKVAGVWTCVDNGDAALLSRVQSIDGGGSGIDADTVDGNDASAFASSGDVSNLNAQIIALQSQVNTLSARVNPYILGRSAQSSSGRFSFGGQNGVRAANAMCVASFPGTASAHLCSLDEIQRAIAMGSYNSGNANTYDNSGTWTASLFDTASGRSNGIQSTCQNLLYNSGDYASGTRVTVDFDYQSPGNGGGVTGDVVKVENSIACGNNMPVLCCR